MSSERFPRRPPRLPFVFQRSTPIYFVTFLTHQRRSWLAGPEVHAAFVAFAEAAAREHEVFIGRYVLMPDHVHLFVRGGPAFRLGAWVGTLRRCLARARPSASQSDAATSAPCSHGPLGRESDTPCSQGAPRREDATHHREGGTPRRAERIWQEGFFDHLLRHDESLDQKWAYVRENPVRAGLVARWEDWPYAGCLHVLDHAEL